MIVDLIIRNGLVEDIGEELDIGIVGEKIVRTASTISDTARVEIDASGCLVSPSFVDPHVHMDKALTIERLAATETTNDLSAWIAAMRSAKAEFKKSDVSERVIRASKLAVLNGTTITRTFVEADPIVNYTCVEAILGVKEICKDIIGIQTVAFPQEGWLTSNDNRELESRPYIAEAMRRGIEVVGGNVNRAMWPSSPEQQVDDLFQLAVEFNADIDIHLDNSDNPVAFTLPYVAHKTIEYGYQGRVTVSHIASLASVPNRVAHDTIDLLNLAEVNVCVLPTRIRLTRVMELFEAGINVIIGTDNLQDAFVQVGTGADMLLAILLMSQVTNAGFADQLRCFYKAGTINAARALGIANYGIAEGNDANVMILEAKTIPDAIRYQARRRAVVKQGKLIVRDNKLLFDV